MLPPLACGTSKASPRVVHGMLLEGSEQKNDIVI